VILKNAIATTFLTKLILKQNLRIVSNSLDIYNRILGGVWLKDRLINAEMLRAGMAYRYGDSDPETYSRIC
jgi:endonuclease YncB( thermonuclease family)